jgi:pimeloyl-ACP methyl ester carboxylesterase
MDLQPQIATFTRACWYDRAGYGWSDPGPAPRDFRAVADDLHALLQVAAMPPPYVLVGEGLAGFHIRVYAGLYRREMAGAVLVNSAEVGPAGHEKGFQPGGLGGLPSKVKALGCNIVGPALLRTGLLRLFWNGHSQQPNTATILNDGQQAELRFLSNTPVAVTGGEGCAVDQSLAEVREAGNLGSVPLVVITSTRPDTRMQEQQVARNHAPGQPQLVALSALGRQVLVNQSDSMSAVMTEAIRDVVNSVRRGSGH